ncbi:MAG: MlaE family ABC transporter permease [Nitrospiria bacterium]
MVKDIVKAVGSNSLGILVEAGALWQLTATSLNRLLVGPFRGDRVRVRSTILQIVQAGYNSLPLVILISLLTGMIVALQSALQLDQVGATSLIANLVAASIIRELAPLLTAIIVAGRFGSAIAAEIGTMKVSQEIDALTVMGINPVSFLVVPRLLALVISLPCLVVFADLAGIIGGLVVAVGTLKFGAKGYMVNTLDALQLDDIATGLVKAVVFAGIIGLVGCQQGLKTSGGAEQVGHATTAAVVRSIVLIIAADLFVTALFYLKG